MYSQAYQKRHSFLHHAFFESYSFLNTCGHVRMGKYHNQEG